jgi:hypothetical protein
MLELVLTRKYSSITPTFLGNNKTHCLHGQKEIVMSEKSCLPYQVDLTLSGMTYQMLSETYQQLLRLGTVTP